MAAQDLTFSIAALDKASRTFLKVAERVERLEKKLDQLDRAKAEPEVDVKIDENRMSTAAATAGRKAARAFSVGAEDEGRRRSGGFFRALFTPNRSIIMALRTGIPAALGSPIGAAAVTLGGLFAASFVAAVISSGAFAVIGGGFTALGAVVLKENARLQDSFTKLGKVAKGQLSQAASSLVPVFDDALRTVQGMFSEHIRAPLEAIFAGLAPTIVPFVQSAVSTVGDVLDTLATPRFTTAMQTVLGSITENLPRFGEAFSEALVEIADHADEIAKAFSGVTTVTSGLIGFAADATVAFTKLFNGIADSARLAKASVEAVIGSGFGAVNLGGPALGQDPFDFAGRVLEAMTGSGFAPRNEPKRGSVGESFSLALKQFFTGGSFTAASEQLAPRPEPLNEWVEAASRAESQASILGDTQEKLRLRLEATNDELGTARDKLDQLKNSMFTSAEQALSLRDAQRQYQEQLDVTRETLERNGETTDINTEKGRENADSIDAMAQAALRQIEAMIQQGKSTEEVTEFTQQARKDFLKAADAAGIEAGEAKRLADRLGLVPSEVKTKAELIDSASEEIKRLKERIREIERQIFVTVHLQRVGFHQPLAGVQEFGHTGGLITGSGLKRFHAGGVLRPDERVIIGQTGERILSRRQTQAFDQLVGAMGRSSGPSFAPSSKPQLVELRITGDGPLFEQIANGVRTGQLQLATSGGGRVTVG